MKKVFTLLLLNILVLTCIFANGCSKKQTDFCEVCFFITDQNGLPIQDVEVIFKESEIKANTLQDGHTPTMNIPIKPPSIKNENWFGSMVLLKAEGYVPVIIFNFVLQYEQTRKAEIMLLTDDGTLPYCAYVEIPSAEAIRRILL